MNLVGKKNTQNSLMSQLTGSSAGALSQVQSTTEAGAAKLLLMPVPIIDMASIKLEDPGDRKHNPEDAKDKDAVGIQISRLNIQLPVVKPRDQVAIRSVTLTAAVAEQRRRKAQMAELGNLSAAGLAQSIVTTADHLGHLGDTEVHEVLEHAKQKYQVPVAIETGESLSPRPASKSNQNEKVAKARKKYQTTALTSATTQYMNKLVNQTVDLLEEKEEEKVKEEETGLRVAMAAVRWKRKAAGRKKFSKYTKDEESGRLEVRSADQMEVDEIPQAQIKTWTPEQLEKQDEIAKKAAKATRLYPRYAIAFKKHDADGNGHIDDKEIFGMMSEFGKDVTQQEVADMMAKLDPDEDGQITFKEWLLLMCPEETKEMIILAWNQLDAKYGSKGFLKEWEVESFLSLCPNIGMTHTEVIDNNVIDEAGIRVLYPEGFIASFGTLEGDDFAWCFDGLNLQLRVEVETSAHRRASFTAPKAQDEDERKEEGEEEGEEQQQQEQEQGANKTPCTNKTSEAVFWQDRVEKRQKDIAAEAQRGAKLAPKYIKMFFKHDKDMSGYIDEEEVIVMLQELGKDVKPEDLPKLMSNMDIDSDGQVTVKEWLKMMAPPDTRPLLSEMWPRLMILYARGVKDKQLLTASEVDELLDTCTNIGMDHSNLIYSNMENQDAGSKVLFEDGFIASFATISAADFNWCFEGLQDPAAQVAPSVRFADEDTGAGAPEEEPQPATPVRRYSSSEV